MCTYAMIDVHTYGYFVNTWGEVRRFWPCDRCKMKDKHRLIYHP